MLCQAHAADETTQRMTEVNTDAHLDRSLFLVHSNTFWLARSLRGLEGDPKPPNDTATAAISMATAAASCKARATAITSSTSQLQAVLC